MIVKIEAEIFWSCLVILGWGVEVRAEKRGWTKFIENPAERRREGRRMLRNPGVGVINGGLGAVLYALLAVMMITTRS